MNLWKVCRPSLYWCGVNIFRFPYLRKEGYAFTPTASHLHLITLLYVHHNHYCFSFSLKKLLQHACIYCHANKASCCCCCSACTFKNYSIFQEEATSTLVGFNACSLSWSNGNAGGLFWKKTGEIGVPGEKPRNKARTINTLNPLTTPDHIGGTRSLSSLR